ncbi:EAL domain-containing protein [Lactobacillus delbrueckii]|nr:EAL domain-containing protein [Lactobacillus delbrueckii]MCT3521747.1 EAL domain-containing protein [Lactobacillus delbrueckii]
MPARSSCSWLKTSGRTGLFWACRSRSLCEGIENRSQSDFLKEIGCQYQQGYLFAASVQPMNCGSSWAKPATSWKISA